MMKLTREDRVAKRRSSPGLPRPSRSDRLAVTVAAFLFGQGDDLAIAAIRESIEHNYRCRRILGGPVKLVADV